jgi:N-glycosylase/DNA lyase
LKKAETAMVTKQLEYFDLRQIWQSGQCFRMEQLSENRFLVIASDRCLEVVQTGTMIEFFCEEEEFEMFWREYFDLDGDYGAYQERINPKDTYLVSAADFGRGIRILKQDLWEMIVSFLISQQNHIPRIRRCIQTLCIQYGKEKSSLSGQHYFTFPNPEDLKNATVEDLLACGLGYRAKYIKQAAERVAKGEVSLAEIQTLPYQEAREVLLSFYGIGVKVADCICLYALHQLEAFPVDTHMNQALNAHYKRGFPKRRYQGIQGVLQQYIFYYELCGKR